MSLKNFKITAMADNGTTFAYCHDIIHQISVQSKILFGERFCLKIFKITDIFDIRME